MTRAATMLAEARTDAKPVDLTVLIPWTEGASLNEDESMAEMWAGLLANAAAGDKGASVLPSFPSTLAEMSPLEAHVLDCLGRFDGYLFRGALSQTERPPVHSNDLYETAMGSRLEDARPEDVDSFEVALDAILWRGFVGPVRDALVFAAGPDPRREYARFALTKLGAAFLRACSFGPHEDPAVE
jgi:hypothetical protein